MFKKINLLMRYFLYGAMIEPKMIEGPTEFGMLGIITESDFPAKAILKEHAEKHNPHCNATIISISEVNALDYNQFINKK